MKKYIIMMLAVLSMAAEGFSQNNIKGKITTKDNGKIEPAIAATIVWLGTNQGVVSDSNGLFSIAPNHKTNKLIVSYIGYKTDTITVADPNKFLNINLKTDDTELEVVEVTYTGKPTRILKDRTENTVNISGNELLKAACCNLSGSFETNATVDVAVSDAVTGTKQIKMLGLKSPYLLMTRENIPYIRGASQTFGMNFIPGSWIQSIQIIKGTGSVINGYEGIAGQINTELIKPMFGKSFYLNLYGSMEGRLELNTYANQVLNDHWATGFYLSGNYNGLRSDMNKDGFLDTPIGHQINVMNRWQYMNKDTGITSQLLLNYLRDDRTAGQKDFDLNKSQSTPKLWGSNIKIDQVNTSAKIGYVWTDKPYQSIGLQTDYKLYDQKSFFGNNIYNVRQHSAYLNLVFGSIIDNTMHKFTTGISANFDNYLEQAKMNNLSDFKRDRNDYGTGAFFEYAYDSMEGLKVNLGLRADVNNRLGFFITPRLHISYTPWKNGTFRLAAGRGSRIANIFAENQNMFMTSRNIDNELRGNATFDTETAWNYGVSFTQDFSVKGHKGDISVDFYRTDFTKRVVVDWENPREISFYDLKGKSFANSFQVEMNFEIIKNLNFRGAYKYYDVKTNYKKGLLQQPLQAQHRFFINLAYETPLVNGGQWKFDYTINFIGKQRLPYTGSNPVQYRLGAYSKPYSLSNAQITKVFSRKFNLYVGVENITNYKQGNTIISNDNPFGKYFDSSIIYAPVFGRMFYAGARISF